MRLQFQWEDWQIELDVEAVGDVWRVRLPDGTEHRIAANRSAEDILQVSEEAAEGSGAHIFRVPFARMDSGVAFSFAGAAYTFTLPTGRTSGGRRGPVSGMLTAPMVGVVADVLVQEGQTVEAYQPLVIIEAMKVMATVEAPFAGTVKTVHVKPAEHVAHGAPLVEVVPDTAHTPENAEG